ncbi:MAG: hypothetical protein ACRD5H_04945 [Nitrososphaerales archaeon]
MYHDHNPIVARSFTWNAAFSIQEEAESLRASVEGFRDDFIQSLREDESTSANAELIAELEASVEEILSMVDCAQLLVTQGRRWLTRAPVSTDKDLWRSPLSGFVGFALFNLPFEFGGFLTKRFKTTFRPIPSYDYSVIRNFVFEKNFVLLSYSYSTIRANWHIRLACPLTSCP